MYFSRPTSTPRSGAQPRVTRRRHRLEIRRPVVAVASAISRPQRRAGQRASAAAPAASSIVGSRSTCRAGVSIVTPLRLHARPAGPSLADDQRHAQRRLVGEDSVRRLAVLAQPFAVIGGDDDQRVARLSRRGVEAAGRARSPSTPPRRGTAPPEIAPPTPPAARRSCADRRRGPTRTTSRAACRSTRAPTRRPRPRAARVFARLRRRPAGHRRSSS